MRRAAWLALVGTLLLPMAAGAQPAPPEASTRYREALLEISASANMDRAIRTYRELLEDPSVRATPWMHVRVLEGLGHAYWSLGELQRALEAFEDCRKVELTGQIPDKAHRCASLARMVALEQGSIRTTETGWTFAPGTSHSFVLLSERGTMRLERTSPDDGVLVWEQELEAEGIAELALGVKLKPESDTPAGIRMQVVSPKTPTLLDLVVYDAFGHSYEAQGGVADDRTRTWDVPFRSLTPRAPSWPPLDPRRIAQIRVRAFNPSDGRTNHRIVLDDVMFY